MKVLMVIKRLDYSGAFKMFMWVAKALANRGIDVTVFTYMSSFVSDLPSNITWIQEDLEKKGFLSQLKAVRRIVKKVKPDISISFLLDANILNILACLGLHTKSIVCERNDPFKPRYYKLKVLKPFFRFANGAVYQLPKVAEYYNNIKVPTAIIPNPVLCQNNIVVKPFVERDNIIVTLGRIDIFQKRHDLLVEAFAIFFKKHPEYKLVIYGIGPDEEKIRNLIERLGLSEAVILGGVVSNSLKIISNAKIFALSSDFEGIPNALIEAMSIGLPCISTDCRPGGAALLIQNNINGILIPSNNVKIMADKMIYLADNSEVADSLGNAAKKIAGQFTEDCIATMWIEYIKKLAG